MVNIEDLKTRTQTPEESDISLSLLANFYEEYISNRIYELDMEDGTKLIFHALNSHFPHLIGLHKFFDINHSNNLLHKRKELKKENGFNNLKFGRIILNDFKIVNGNNKKYKQFKKRILNFPFSYQLLRDAVFISYDKAKVSKNTKINGDYVFINDIDDDKLHFFFINETDENMDDENIDNESVPITFIVTRKDDFSFVENQDIFKIEKIIIKDFISHEIMETYDFSEANHSVIGQSI